MKRGTPAGSQAASRLGRFSAAAREGAASRAAMLASAQSSPLPVAPPTWLPAAAAQVWREIRPSVHPSCSAADVDMLASWCLATAQVARWAKSRAGSAGGHLRAALRVQLALANSLGLSPLGRAKLPPVQEPKVMSEREATIASLVR